MSYDNWLFRKLFQEKSDQNYTDPEFSQYLQEIATFHADRLVHEPVRLAEEKSILEEDTENLAFSNYKTFIQAANCSKEIFDDFVHINRNVDELLKNLPILDEECQKFSSEAQKINSKRSNNSLTLQKHTQILEILEIPQVMDTCVRAGYYDEALELGQYATKLERRLGYIPIVQAIAEEIKNQRGLLLENLLDQLKTNLNLSSCLKVVAYLRRLNVFTEAELRIKFLLARNAWFENMLAAIPKDNSYQHITKTIEVSRVHLFDIITQYRAVFSDEDPMFLLGARGADAVHLQSIFNSFLIEKLEQFSSALRIDLASGVDGRMDSVLAQCMHFGLSLGRVGVDFRPLVVPIFENYVQLTFVHTVDSASNELAKDFLDDKFLETATNFSNHSSIKSAPNSEPPTSLLRYPPLALFCNSILTVFNNLRLCLPINLAGFFAENLQHCLVKIAEDILSLSRRPESLQWPKPKSDCYRDLCRVFLEDLLPFMDLCLEILFPEKQLAEILGVNSSDLPKMKHSFRLDGESLRDILKDFVHVEKQLAPVLVSKEDHSDSHVDSDKIESN